jgi:RNA polymerase sigma factor for flagellar operon FliA
MALAMESVAPGGESHSGVPVDAKTLVSNEQPSLSSADPSCMSDLDWRDAFLRDGDGPDASVLAAAYSNWLRQSAQQVFAKRGQSHHRFEEYVQWGWVGLLEAARRFDPSVGTDFRAYAIRFVTGAIHDGLASLTELDAQVANQRRLRRQRLLDLETEAPEGEPNTGEWLWQQLQGRRDDNDATARQRHAHLFARLSDLGVGVALGTLLEGTSMFAQDEAQALQQSAYDTPAHEQGILKRQLAEQVGRLPEAERMIIHRIYHQGQALDDLAITLKVSRSRVSQLHRSALKKLRALLEGQTAAD